MRNYGQPGQKIVKAPFGDVPRKKNGGTPLSSSKTNLETPKIRSKAKHSVTMQDHNQLTDLKKVVLGPIQEESIAEVRMNSTNELRGGMKKSVSRTNIGQKPVAVEFREDQVEQGKSRSVAALNPSYASPQQVSGVKSVKKLGRSNSTFIGVGQQVGLTSLNQVTLPKIHNRSNY